MPKKDKETDKLASVSVISSPILAKSSKKVIEISRFFKKKIDNKGKIICSSVILELQYYQRNT